jgi:predicted protein tyrosine phosphatase
MQIRICGVEEIDLHAPWATHIVSISTAEGRSVMDRFLVEARGEILRLDFNDTANPGEAGSPQAGHIGEIIRFGLTVPEDGRLLVHCMAGVSRSTAAAWAILCARHPERSAEELFWEVMDLRPIARPNVLMTALADKSLKRKGEMVMVLHIWKNTSQL